MITIGYEYIVYTSSNISMIPPGIHIIYYIDIELQPDTITLGSQIMHVLITIH